MKKALLPLLIFLLLLLSLPALADTAMTAYSVEALGLNVLFPTGWTVVTPDTVADHFEYFDATSPEIAAQMLRDEGVYALAYSPEKNVCLRILAKTDDAAAQLYWEIDRYPSALRTAIKEDFLNKQAWQLTGFRCSAADWTNRESQGRLLWMEYVVRFDEEITTRGRRVFTVRNGIVFTLDMQRYDGRLTSADDRIFEDFVAGASFPVSESLPLLPTELALTKALPEESDTATLDIRGSATAGALITVWAQASPEAEAEPIGSSQASSGGSFRFEAQLPGEGEWIVTVTASLEEHTETDVSGHVSVDYDRLPVSFTSYPEGDVYDKKIVISGTAPAGTKIQCMEGDGNIKRTVGSDKAFSFTLDADVGGERKVVLAFDKDGYSTRRFTFVFNRCWTNEDYIALLEKQRQSLSYENFSGNPAKFEGRIVRYSGTVVSVSQSLDRTYVEIATAQEKDGTLTDRFVAIYIGEVDLIEGAQVRVYGSVNGDTYTFSSLDEDGFSVSVNLPSLTLLAYTLE